MSTEVSRQHSYISPRNVRPLSDFKVDGYEGLKKYGISMDSKSVNQLMSAMDAIQGLVTTPSMATPVQFLQEWLPGLVYILTAARNIDLMIGVSTLGAWESEEIVQKVLEHVGKSNPYGDTSNLTVGSWNVNFERRTMVRFEQGLRVGRLEEARASAMQVNSAAEKRFAAAEELEIRRNLIGFNGYNSGLNRTYGFLNDPGLPAYVAVPNGASGSSLWSSKTFLEIAKDIRSSMQLLRTQSKDRIDPRNTKITIGLATSVVDYMTTTSDLGESVEDWLKKAYPNTRVVSAPELDAANGGANVMYVFAEEVADSGTDDRKTFIQAVPTKFQLLGIQQLVKGFEEGYTNATAGVMLKRPIAVIRRTGV